MSFHAKANAHKSEGKRPISNVLQHSAVNISDSKEVPEIVYDVLRSAGQSLDTQARAFMEPRFGQDFSGVHVHTDSRATESAQAVNARAYTVGNDIVFGTGQYAPNTITGRRLVAHELTHVVQQSSDSSNSIQLASNSVDSYAEREATRMSEQITRPEPMPPSVGTISRSPRAVYRQVASATLAPAATPKSKAQEADAARNAIYAEAREDALRIKRIFQEDTWYKSLNQVGIMAIAEKWATRPLETPYSRLSSFDYFVVALRGVTFEAGTVVKQYTSAFDQIFHQLSSDRIAQFKKWMQTQGRTFKDEKAIEMVKFEVSKEDVLEAVQMSAEVVAAAGTGGGSVLIQIGLWLTQKLPGLYQKAKTIIDYVDALRNIKLENVKAFFSAEGLGNLLVKVLFGEARGLPQIQETDDKEEKEPTSGFEEKGLIRILHLLKRIFNALKQVYSKVAAFVSQALGFANITTQSWFTPFSMVYASVVKAVEAISNPGAVISEAAGKIRETITAFFKGIQTRAETAAGNIKSHLDLIGKPSQLLKILADKGVEMVLNLIITNPPSALVKAAFRAIEAGAKTSIIELVRKNLPFADDLIKKIAESDTVKRLIQPLEPPISKATGAIESVTGRAVGLINEAQGQTLDILGSSTDTVKLLAGGISSEVPEKAGTAEAKLEGGQRSEAKEPTAGGSFLSVVKQGIHTRLLAIGGRNLLDKGKELGNAAIEKGKASAGEITDAIRQYLAKRATEWAASTFSELGFKKFEVEPENEWIIVYGYRSPRIRIADLRTPDLVNRFSITYEKPEKIKTLVPVRRAFLKGAKGERKAFLEGAKAGKALPKGDETWAKILQNQANLVSEEIGIIGAKEAVKRTFGFSEKDIYLESRESGALDLVYKREGIILVVECKGGRGGKTTRQLGSGIVAEQMSPEYLIDVLKEMEGKKVKKAKPIRCAYEEGRLIYVHARTYIPKPGKRMTTILKESKLPKPTNTTK